MSESILISNTHPEYFYATDAEIIILFLQLIKSFQDKKPQDFLLEKAKKSNFNPQLYHSVLNLSKLLISYSK